MDKRGKLPYNILLYSALHAFQSQLIFVALHLLQKYPAQYDHSVVELTPEQKANPDLKYFTATHDFKYECINVVIIRAFLSAEKKYKDDTKTTQYSEVHIRKYHDAIKFGMRTIDALPSQRSITPE